MTLPERGKPAKTFGPKYPSNHRTSNITIIKLSMRFLLLCDLYYTSSYNKHPPTASIRRGVLFSATWGRQIKANLELVLRNRAYSTGTVKVAGMQVKPSPIEYESFTPSRPGLNLPDASSKSKSGEIASINRVLLSSS